MKAQASTETMILIATTAVLVALLTYLVLGILESQKNIADKPFDLSMNKISNIIIQRPTTSNPFKITLNQGQSYGEIQAEIIQKKPANLISFVVIDREGKKISYCEINSTFNLNEPVNTVIRLGTIEVYRIEDESSCPSENPCCLKPGYYNVKVEAKFYHNDANETAIEKKAVIIE